MAENTNIEWCDRTENAWIGCSKRHTGCKNCFAETMSNNRFTGNLYNEIVWGENAKRYRVKGFFKNLNTAQRKAKRKGIKETVFVGSMMDIFENNKPLLNPTDDFKDTNSLRYELFCRISNGKYDNLIFLFLTKRPENIYKHSLFLQCSQLLNNVWAGTSISDQKTADIYINELRKCILDRRFLSIEPQVSEINEMNLNGINWVIQGGESGPKKRLFRLRWAKKVKEICESQNVPYFFKQIDKIKPIPENLNIKQYPEF